MFTAATAANYKSTEGLLVWYDQETDSSAYPYLTRLTRHATKRYSFRDLVPSDAATVAAAKTAQYTRSFQQWKVEGDEIVHTTVTECRTDITVTPTACGSCDVVIAIHEQDVIFVESIPVTNPEAEFTEYVAGRDYDETVCPKTTDGRAAHGTTNLRVANDLAIRYAVELRKINNLSLFVYTRYATKRFDYLGMRQSAAEACAAAMIAKFTREYSHIDSGSSPYARTSLRLGAAVTLRHVGQTWCVSVAVNETDVKAYMDSRNPAVVFAAENQREY